MAMIVIVILVALAVGLAGTLLFGPLLLIVGVLVLIAGLAWARRFGRQAGAVADVAEHPHEVLTAPEPDDLAGDARRRAAAAQPDATAGAASDAERARRRAGTT